MTNFLCLSCLLLILFPTIFAVTCEVVVKNSKDLHNVGLLVVAKKLNVGPFCALSGNSEIVISAHIEGEEIGNSQGKSRQDLYQAHRPAIHLSGDQFLWHLKNKKTKYGWRQGRHKGQQTRPPKVRNFGIFG